jgi:hypothetical protein
MSIKIKNTDDCENTILIASTKEECLIIPEYVRNNQKKNILTMKKLQTKNVLCEVRTYFSPVPLNIKKVKINANTKTNVSISTIIHLGR